MKRLADQLAGAGGGVGSIAVQVAKANGARVTGVDRTEKLEMIRSLGADRVIDYTEEDFTQRAERYDLILDVASNLSLKASKRALTPEGVYLVIGHDHFGEAKGRVSRKCAPHAGFACNISVRSPPADFGGHSRSH